MMSGGGAGQIWSLRQFGMTLAAALAVELLLEQHSPLQVPCTLPRLCVLSYMIHEPFILILYPLSLPNPYSAASTPALLTLPVCSAPSQCPFSKCRSWERLEGWDPIPESPFQQADAPCPGRAGQNPEHPSETPWNCSGSEWMWLGQGKVTLPMAGHGTRWALMSIPTENSSLGFLLIPLVIFPYNLGNLLPLWPLQHWEWGMGWLVGQEDTPAWADAALAAPRQFRVLLLWGLPGGGFSLKCQPLPNPLPMPGWAVFSPRLTAAAVHSANHVSEETFQLWAVGFLSWKHTSAPIKVK